MKNILSFALILFIVVFLQNAFAQTGCGLKSRGDADCNGAIENADFEIWRKEKFNELTTKTADFNGDIVIDIIDFEIWRKNRFGTVTTPSPTPSSTIAPTVTRTPTPVPNTPTPSIILTPQPAGKGIWISKEEIMRLPIAGQTGCNTNCSAAWNRLAADAQNSVSNPDFVDQNSKNDVYILAKALVYARTDNASYRAQVRDGLKLLVSKHPISSSSSWDWLGILRGLGSYVIAADLIDLKSYDATFDQAQFRPWLKSVRSAIVEGGRGSVISAQEKRPNNFGSHGSASRIATALYLNDTADLNRAIQVFKGYLGDRASYAGFTYGADLSWQCNESAPVGINPAGCVKNGHNIDGVIPDDMRRVSEAGASCGNMAWPPCKNANTNYVWEGLQGVVVSSEMLHRAGHDAFNWQNKAVKRAINWMYTTTFSDGQPFPAEGDDAWIVAIINKRYNTTYSPGSGSTPGKMVGYADWTHQ